jgi:hypothetical protein
MLLLVLFVFLTNLKQIFPIPRGFYCDWLWHIMNATTEVVVCTDLNTTVFSSFLLPFSFPNTSATPRPGHKLFMHYCYVCIYMARTSHEAPWLLWLFSYQQWHLFRYSHICMRMHAHAHTSLIILDVLLLTPWQPCYYLTSTLIWISYSKTSLDITSGWESPPL